MAWLRTTPESSDKKVKYNPRYQDYDADDVVMQMPVVDCLLLAAWEEAGQYRATEKGITNISWLELEACDRVLGLNLAPWQLSIVMDMSKAYCDYHSKAKDEHCPMAYMLEEGEQAKRRRLMRMYERRRQNKKAS